MLARGSNIPLRPGPIGILLTLAAEIPRLWFLWALLGSLVLTWLANSMGQYRMLAFLVVFAGLLLLPDTVNMPLLKYMFPFFVFGFLLASVDLSKIPRGHVGSLTLASGVASIICYAFWKDASTSSVTALSWLPSTSLWCCFSYVAMRSHAASLRGLVLLAQRWTPAKLEAWIETAGRDCILIYILQVYAFGGWQSLPESYMFPPINTTAGHVVALMLGLLITVGCWLAGSTLSRNSTCGLLLFGRSPRVGVRTLPLATGNPRP